CDRRERGQEQRAGERRGRRRGRPLVPSPAHDERPERSWFDTLTTRERGRIASSDGHPRHVSGLLADAGGEFQDPCHAGRAPPQGTPAAYVAHEPATASRRAWRDRKSVV